MRIWLLRLLMGVLLVFGSELVLWVDPPGRGVLDWLLLITGYSVLAALLLDLMARYRVRSIYEVMMVVAIYGLLNGLLLNPATTLDDFPRTLVSRIIGAHTLIGLEMFGLLLALISGKTYARLLIGFSVWLGFFWGIWVRWSPSLTTWLDAEVPLSTMFLYGGVVLLVVLALWGLFFRQQPHTLSLPELRLSQQSWSVAVIIMIVLFLLQVIRQGLTEFIAIPVILLMVGLCVTVLWFQRGEKSRTVFDHSLPPQPLPLPWLAGTALTFCISTIIAYNLPLFDLFGYNQLSIMELGFVGVGFLWFPVALAVIGGRALDRQTRKLNL